jgi:hypothetical protein
MPLCRMPGRGVQAFGMTNIVDTSLGGAANKTNGQPQTRVSLT